MKVFQSIENSGISLSGKALRCLHMRVMSSEVHQVTESDNAWKSTVEVSMTHSVEHMKR